MWLVTEETTRPQASSLRPASLTVSFVSKHILNAQVAIRAPCCKQWFDCPECHAEKETHRLAKAMEMIFLCKKCKKAFRKDMSNYEESDEYCPHCDNHYVCSLCYLRRTWNIKSVSILQVIDAKTPQAALMVEGEDERVDARYDIFKTCPLDNQHAYTAMNRMIKDERIKQSSNSLAFDEEFTDRMG
jgi:uncharacterized CHY-type Zn-finger protein